MGIMSDIGSLLKNPAVMELLPAALGAAGGALTSPRRGGVGGSIGNALTGAAGGLAQGEQAVAGQQRAAAYAARTQEEAQYRDALIAHTKIQDQIAQGKEELITQRDNAFAKLPKADQDRFGTPSIWEKTMINTLVKGAPVPAKKDAVASMFNSPTGKAYLAARGLTDPSQLPDDPKALDTLLSSFHYESPDVAALRTANLKRINAETGKIGMEEAGTLPARPTAAGGAKGAVTDSQAMSHALSQFDKMRTENEKVAIENAKNDYPGATPAPLPHPDLPANFEDWSASKAGQDFINAYKGEKAAAPKAAAGAKDDLKAAPDFHKVKGATGPAIAKAVKDGKTMPDGMVTKPDGKHYIIKNGYGYPA
jgi:hypothetical protein